MSGILHFLFGLIVGIVFLKMTGNAREKKGWTLGLFFVFVINNYFGPDLRGFVKRVFAIPLQSETLYLFSESIHSYVGWVVWALLWAPLWYGILTLMERERQKRANRVPDSKVKREEVVYTEVFLAVLIGGICHLFVDTLGHVEEVGGTYQFLGAIELLTPWNADVILCYVILAGSIIGGILLWRVRSKKLARGDLFLAFKRILRSRQVKRIFLFVGIALGNAFLLYGVMAAGNLVDIETQTFPWNGQSYTVIAFNLANALLATKFFSGSPTWYTAVTTCAFIVLFVVSYSRISIVHFRGHQVRVDYLIIAATIGSIVLGYLLQPVIGNISGKEADFGAFIFLWAFLLFPLVIASRIRESPNEKSEETRSGKLD